MLLLDLAVVITGPMADVELTPSVLESIRR
jgi:hypothetical protein